MTIEQKCGTNFVTSFSQKKIQSAKNKKHTIFWNDKLYIWAKVQVAGFKNKKDE